MDTLLFFLGFLIIYTILTQKLPAAEKEILSQHAKEIFDILPRTDAKREEYLLNAQKYASRISWENSAKDYVFGFNPST